MPKNIIICFDGTRNDPDDADQEIYEEGGVEDDGISNILKLYFLLGGRIENLNQVESEEDDPLLPSAFADQPVFYFQGVGTYGGPIGKLLNAALSPRKLDVRRIIRNGIAVLKAHYEPGDQVIVFGFSRGAAIARRFANVITRPKYELGLTEKPIRFLGVFDTVASFGLPNLKDKDLPSSKVIFEDQNRVSKNVAEALHLVSLDERRNAFKPTLMAAEERVTEIWMPGVHSDVGGGYFYNGLSDLSLQLMLDELKIRLPQLHTRTPDTVVETEFVIGEYGLDKQDIKIAPTHLSTIHWHERIGDVFLGDRDPRVCASKNNAAVNQAPIIHNSAIDRIVDDHSYRTASLYDEMPHKVFEKDRIISEAAPFDIESYRVNRERPSRSLSVGNEIKVQIQAAQLNCPTFIHVKPGEKYSFAIDPTIKWVDKTIKCGAGGWKASEVISFFKRPFFSFKEGDRRHPNANWFELLGNIDRDDEKLFRVCDFQQSPITVDSEGELFMFPNDLTDYYGNNRGYLEVTVKRVA